jgi:hypothetical protein
MQRAYRAIRARNLGSGLASSAPTKPPPLGEQYRRLALLFSVSGRWHISRYQRPGAKGYDGCPTEPPIPPQEMTDLELERIQRLLAKQSWTLVRNSEGLLVPVRTI